MEFVAVSYIYMIVLGHHLLWRAAQQSRAYSTIPNGKCLSSSFLPGEWLLSCKTWCPLSSSSPFQISRKRTWGHIILCEGKGKQDLELLTGMFLSVLSYKQVLQLVVCSACVILFLGIVNLKSWIYVLHLYLKSTDLCLYAKVFQGSVHLAGINVQMILYLTVSQHVLQVVLQVFLEDCSCVCK